MEAANRRCRVGMCREGGVEASGRSQSLGRLEDVAGVENFGNTSRIIRPRDWGSSGTQKASLFSGVLHGMFLRLDSYFPKMNQNILLS